MTSMGEQLRWVVLDWCMYTTRSLAWNWNERVREVGRVGRRPRVPDLFVRDIGCEEVS